VNGSTTKLGASYFFEIPSDRYSHPFLKDVCPPKGGFFIANVSDQDSDLNQDLGL